MALHPVANIDLTALQHNFSQVKQHAPKSRVMSVIKADAYGHGMIEAAHALAQSDAFAVARLAEGLALRQAGIKQAIVLLEGVATVEDLQQASDNQLSIVFHHQSQLDLLDKISLTQPLQFSWLMLETGMNRLGMSEADIEAALTRLEDSPNITGSIGLMSHFANSDLIGDKRNHQQLERLKRVAEQFNLITSMANSGAILSYPESHGNWVRPGIMLYGSSPFNNQSATELGLKPVMKLTASITAIQTIQTGQQVGYGGDWVATKPSQIAIVCIGYGDGYSRHLSNKGHVLIDDTLALIVGRVSMDMIAVDIGEMPDCKIGDQVVLWGDDKLTIDTVAHEADTISYELLCHINKRVVREYRGES